MYVHAIKKIFHVICMFSVAVRGYYFPSIRKYRATLLIGGDLSSSTATRLDGEFRLTPSARAILEYLSERQEEPVTKAAIAAELGRCEKTVDRLMSRMREEGMIEVHERWGSDGAQLANSYSVRPVRETVR